MSRFLRERYNVAEQMDRQHIIDEIRRTAAANDGIALGWRRFTEETGISY